MKHKKSLSVILALVMMLSILPAPAALGEPSVKELMPAVPEGYRYYGESFTDANDRTIYYISAPDGDLGVSKGYWIDVYGNRVDNPVKKITYDLDRSKGGLPSKYDSRELGLVTAVESQISGTCWAHAMIAALESNAIKKGLADNTLDLNEYHTVWNAGNGYFEGCDDSRNDGYVASSLSAMLSDGGSTTMASRALGNFSGAVSEQSIPVNSTNVSSLISEMGKSLSFDNKFDREITMAQTVSVGSKESAIKKAVMEYGGLYFAYSSYSPAYSHYSLSGDPVTTYYNATGKSDAGHAVEIIGWDDDFPVENFSQDIRPKNNGAWLLKNSWGANYGNNNGFFWMSYEESSVYGITAVVAASPDEFEKVYFYDGSGYSRAIPATMAANVFTADDDIALTKFSAGNTVTREYTLEIYRLNAKYSDPTDGELIYTQSGNLNGLKYVDITGDVTLKKGDVFSVVIKGLINCYAEGTGSSLRKFTSHKGESFYYDGEWKDCHETGNHNVCIRAVANTIVQKDSYKVSFVCPKYNTIVKYSENGRVELPETEGCTWEFTYNGRPFDGTGVTKNMSVEAHCYPTDGTPSKTCGCTTEYKCIFCSKEMKASVTRHDFYGSVTEASKTGAGYSKNTCIKCGYAEVSDFKAFPGADMGVVGDICWQYADGILSVSGIGEMRDYAYDDAPWSKYRESTGKIVINEGVTTVGAFSFYGFSAESISLPESLHTICADSFENMRKLGSLIIPDGVVKIGDYAFENDDALKSVSFGEKVESIGDYAFAYCRSLKLGVIPDTIYDLGSGIYSYCSGMESLVVEEGVSEVYSEVYDYSRSDEYSLKEVMIPSTLEYVSTDFFKSLNRGAAIKISEKNKYFDNVDGVIFYDDMRYLCSYPGSKTDVFYSVPESVVGLWSYAFYNNPNIKYLDLSSCTARSLPKYCVYGNNSLVNINLPASLYSMADYSIFSNGKLTALYIPSTVGSISDRFLSSYMGEYPTIYTDIESSPAAAYAAKNQISCVTGHENHEYKLVLEGDHTDCISASYRVLACKCGEIKQFSGEHCYEWVTDKAADCGNSGIMHRECIVCGAVADKGTVIPASGKHDFISDTANVNTIVTPATCSEAAVYCLVCSQCGALDKSSTFSSGVPRKHSFTGESRYNGNGTHSIKCIYCGVWSVGTGCNWQFVGNERGKDCKSMGLNHYTCSVCGGATSVSDGVFGEHTPSDPRYNGEGYHTGVCSACGLDSTVPCTWKLISSNTGKDCKTEGLNEYECTVCGGKTYVPNGKFAPHRMIFGKCTVCGHEDGSGIGGIFRSIAKLFGDLFAKIKALFTFSLTADLTVISAKTAYKSK